MSTVAPQSRLWAAAAVPAAAPAGFWTLCALGVLLALALPAVKLAVGFEVRVGQLLLAGAFAVLALRDLQCGSVLWGPLLALAGAGAVLAGMSVLAPYPQVKETTFLVKYLVLFPAAFYLGARLLPLLGAARLATVLEVTLAAALLLALVLEAFPVPALVHERPEHLSAGLQGSFWEQGELAFFAGLFTIAALGLRIEHAGWPARPWLPAAVYALALSCALASLNKTVWLALLGACLAAAVAYRGSSAFGAAARAWAPRLALLAGIGVVALALYNAWLPPGEKLVTAEMLRHKWEAERGASLRIAWALIREAPLLGYGFGFVEAYFGTAAVAVIGLGSGVAQLFNAYLDLWVSAGLVGLAYALGLLAACFGPRSLVSVMTVAYLFIFANLNPVAQHEYYHLFLGLALAATRTVATSEEGGLWRRY